MDIYIALAEPKRRLILEQLAKHGELAAGEISKKFKITASAISQHLNILLNVGLVKQERQAQKRIYSLNQSGINELDEWLGKIKKDWEYRLDNLDKLLQESK